MFTRVKAENRFKWQIKANKKGDVMKRVPDGLIKYVCHDCNEQFIVSERVEEKVKYIWCPYCTSEETEQIVWENNTDKLNELGCLGIYHDE